MIKKRTVWLVLLCELMAAAIIAMVSLNKSVQDAASRTLPAAGSASVDQRVRQYGPAARERLKPYFQKANVVYPPSKLALIGVKDCKVLEVWASGTAGGFVHLRDYAILGASGELGPKLREGDRQVPEGLYRIESLNPNSRYHLALRVSYPNAFDRRRGEQDGRSKLGGDIMIHGSNCSIGCLAMGDEAAEELFVLAAETGLENIQVVLTPTDFRRPGSSASTANLPQWTSTLYNDIRSALKQFQRQ